MRQAVIWFAAVVAGYWLYWLIAVPLIEPGVDERSTAAVSQAQIDEARADVSARQRDVARYFSPDDWEANKPAIWRSGQMRLLYKTIEPQSDGTVALRPCTLMFFPDRGGTSQPVIMRAMEGAIINMINGYPTANVSTVTPGGIILASQINPTADNVTVSVVGNSVTIDTNGGTAPNCRVTYTEPVAVNTSPVIVVDVSGC